MEEMNQPFLKKLNQKTDLEIKVRRTFLATKPFQFGWERERAQRE